MERKDGRPKNYVKADRTRKKIIKALLYVLETKPIDQVSVQDICDVCDIHRTTFYRHFDNIYEVINGMSEEITKALSEVLEVLDSKNVWFDFLADFIVTYRNPIKNINKTRYKEMFTSPFAIILYEFYRRLFKMENLEIAPGMRSEWLIRYHIAGTLAMAEHWLEEDCTREECRLGIEGMYTMIFGKNIQNL